MIRKKWVLFCLIFIIPTHVMFAEPETKKIVEMKTVKVPCYGLVGIGKSGSFTKEEAVRQKKWVDRNRESYILSQGDPKYVDNLEFFVGLVPFEYHQNLYNPNSDKWAQGYAVVGRTDWFVDQKCEKTLKLSYSLKDYIEKDIPTIYSRIRPIRSWREQMITVAEHPVRFLQCRRLGIVAFKRVQYRRCGLAPPPFQGRRF